LTFPTRSAILIRFIDDADERGAQVAVTRLQAPPNLASGAVLLAWAASSASASPEHSQEQAWELWWGADTGLGLALDRITLRDGSSVRMGSLPRAIVALTVRPDTSVRLLLIQPEGSLAVVRWPSLEPIFTLPTIQVPPGGALRPGGLWAGDDLLIATSATTLWHVQVEPEALQP